MARRRVWLGLVVPVALVPVFIYASGSVADVVHCSPSLAEGRTVDSAAPRCEMVEPVERADSPHPGSADARLLAGDVSRVGAGEFRLEDFGEHLHGADLAAAGLQGAGSALTTISMRPGSSSRAAVVPTVPYETNQLDLLAVVGGAPVVRGFTLAGTDQGHLYNGLLVGKTQGFRGDDLRVRGVPGSASFPPGETFAVNDWRTVGSRWSNLVVDGAGVGAAGFGANSSRQLEVRDSTFTGTRYSSGMAIWQTTDVLLDRIRVVGNRSGINFERSGGQITIRDAVFSGNGRFDLQFGTDLAGGDVEIIDPVLAPGQRLRINCPNQYHGGVNGQARSRIRVTVGGVDETSRLVSWL